MTGAHPDLRVVERPSPNRAPRPAGTAIDTLVLHYTGMTSAEAAIERLCDPAAKVSSHYVVDEDGLVSRLVDERWRASHAGVSFWRGREDLNDGSIGIEIVNPGHEWGYRDFPADQIDAVEALCLAILSRHPIERSRVVGHSDVAPDRKQDPGERFPWRRLARAGIGAWPDAADREDANDPTPLGTVDADRLRRILGEIGYRAAPPDDPRTALPVLVPAFRRRWRPARVEGAPDLGTLRVARAVRDLLGPAPAGER